MPEIETGPQAGGNPQPPITNEAPPEVPEETPRVVIVGAGFAGLNLAKALARLPVDVLVIDRTNHHLFQPLLYQVATAGLSPGEIAAPVREILGRQANGTEFGYDFLALATGARHSYFGRAEWEAHAPGLKTLGDALDLRRRILGAFEQAELTEDPAEREACLRFVVVGGGPTGVEMAGAIAELARFTLDQEYRRFRPADTRVLLVEAGKRVLPSFSDRLSASARRQLERLGVEVRCGSPVTGMGPDGVALGPVAIRARTVIWAAGNEGSPVGRLLGAPLDRNGRVMVEPDLSVPGHPEVFVLGDLAHVAGEDGQALPGVSPVAIQQGRHTAENLRRRLAGGGTLPFRYSDKGSMATIGRNAAVAQIGTVEFGGFTAWLAWLLFHLVFLIGFRNRAAVLLRWMHAYFTYRKGARIIGAWPSPSPTPKQPNTP
jgi:NADH dehydrogenase